MIRRRMAALVLSGTLLAAPLAATRAAAEDYAPESRVGVILMVVCGLSLRAAIPAPVPWAGVAVMSCLFGFLDAAFSADTTSPPADPSPPPTP